MAEKGRIVKIEGDRATVELEPTPSCARCGLCRRDEAGRMLLEVASMSGLAEGQRVLIEGIGATWRASILLFLVPMVDLIVGIILGQFVAIGGLSHDASSAIFGLAFFGVSLGGAVVIDRRLARAASGQRPHIVMVLEDGRA